MPNPRACAGPITSWWDRAGFTATIENGAGQTVVLVAGVGIARMRDAPLRGVDLHIEASGLEWTFVRPNWFFQSFLASSTREEIVARGVITAPMGDARLALVDARDVAAVAAEALVHAGTGAHRNVAYAISGDDAPSHHEIVAATGRSIHHADAWRVPSQEASS